jgi:hypothetical protein
MKSRAEQVVYERFVAMHKGDPDAIKDSVKRINFGVMLCNEDDNDFKFIFKGYDKTPVSCHYRISAMFSPSRSRQQGRRKEKFMSANIIETLAVHFQCSVPSLVVKNIPFHYPIGGLALAITAVSNSYIIIDRL